MSDIAGGGALVVKAASSPQQPVDAMNVETTPPPPGEAKRDDNAVASSANATEASSPQNSGSVDLAVPPPQTNAEGSNVSEQKQPVGNVGGSGDKASSPALPGASDYVMVVATVHGRPDKLTPDQLGYTPEELRQWAPSLIGKPVDIAHSDQHAATIIGKVVNAEYDEKLGELVASLMISRKTPLGDLVANNLDVLNNVSLTSDMIVEEDPDTGERRAISGGKMHGVAIIQNGRAGRGPDCTIKSIVKENPRTKQMEFSTLPEYITRVKAWLASNDQEKKELLIAPPTKDSSSKIPIIQKSSTTSTTHTKPVTIQASTVKMSGDQGAAAVAATAAATMATEPEAKRQQLDSSHSMTTAAPVETTPPAPAPTPAPTSTPAPTTTPAPVPVVTAPIPIPTPTVARPAESSSHPEDPNRARLEQELASIRKERERFMELSKQTEAALKEINDRKNEEIAQKAAAEMAEAQKRINEFHDWLTSEGIPEQTKKDVMGEIEGLTSSKNILQRIQASRNMIQVGKKLGASSAQPTTPAQPKDGESAVYTTPAIVTASGTNDGRPGVSSSAAASEELKAVQENAYETYRQMFVNPHADIVAAHIEKHVGPAIVKASASGLKAATAPHLPELQTQAQQLLNPQEQCTISQYFDIGAHDECLYQELLKPNRNEPHPLTPYTVRGSRGSLNRVLETVRRPTGEVVQVQRGPIRGPAVIGASRWLMKDAIREEFLKRLQSDAPSVFDEVGVMRIPKDELRDLRKLGYGPPENRTWESMGVTTDYMGNAV